MKRLSFWLAVLMALSFAAQAPAADTLAKTKAGGALVAGVMRDAPPFGFLDRSTGKLAGYDVDYAALLAEKLGVKPVALAVPDGGAAGALATGKVDLVAANLTKPASGATALDYSDVYLVTGQRLLARKGGFASMADVVGKKIGVVLGTPSEDCARSTCPAAQIIPFPSYDAALTALYTGEVDAFSSDQAILAEILAMLPGGQWEIPNFSLSEESYVLGLPKGDAAFRDFVNKAIAELKADGTADRLKERWFSPATARPSVAWGAVVRKTVTGHRILGVTLDGVMLPDAEIHVYTAEGNRVARGKVVSTVGDEFYFDVDEDAYNLMRPGFLVTMNVAADFGRSLALEQAGALSTVKASADKEVADILAQANREADARAKLNADMQKQQEVNKTQILLERERYRQLRRLYNNTIFRQNR